MDRKTKRSDERNPNRGRAGDESRHDVAPDPKPAEGERGFEERDRGSAERERGDFGSPMGPTADETGRRETEGGRERL